MYFYINYIITRSHRSVNDFYTKDNDIKRHAWITWLDPDLRHGVTHIRLIYLFIFQASDVNLKPKSMRPDSDL